MERHRGGRRREEGRYKPTECTRCTRINIPPCFQRSQASGCISVLALPLLSGRERASPLLLPDSSSCLFPFLRDVGGRTDSRSLPLPSSSFNQRREKERRERERGRDDLRIASCAPAGAPYKSCRTPAGTNVRLFAGITWPRHEG